MSLVSIIIPLFNREDLIKETINSIFAQTYDDWEIIVVDDGSTDLGPNYIKNLSLTNSKIKLINREHELKGPSSCRNLGAQLANGNYLLFLDSDDLITPTCLQNRVSYIEKNPNLDFVVFPQESFSIKPGDGKLFSKYFNTNNEYLSAFIADKHPWQTSAPIWRRSSFINLGGFNERYSMIDDQELHIRSLLAGLKFEAIQGIPDFYYRLAPKTPEQDMQFWKLSIIKRIPYYLDIKQTFDKYNAWDSYKADVSKSYINFQKYLLLWRVNEFTNEYMIIKQWAESLKLISWWKSLLIHLYFKFNSKSSIYSKLPLKGLIYKFI